MECSGWRASEGDVVCSHKSWISQFQRFQNLLTCHNLFFDFTINFSTRRSVLGTYGEITVICLLVSANCWNYKNSLSESLKLAQIAETILKSLKLISLKVKNDWNWKFPKITHLNQFSRQKHTHSCVKVILPQLTAEHSLYCTVPLFVPIQDSIHPSLLWLSLLYH
jgi:hypothetical protein